jgi:hypothetical protein
MKARKFEPGQRVWEFDPNRRVYSKAPPGKIWAKGGPIFAEHFRPMQVYRIEGRSYLIGTPPGEWGGEKFARKYGFDKAERLFRTYAEREGEIWMDENRYRLIRVIERCRDLEILKRVAELVGYVEASR